MRWALAASVLFAAPLPAEQVVFAGGHWAAIDRGSSCEAAGRSLRIAQKGKVQARAGFAFDAGRGRRGQFFAQLSRMPRANSTVILTVGEQPFLLVGRSGWAWSSGAAQESAIIAAVRAAGGMRIESRDQAGRRFVDRYMLDGAPTAIDAAAARCAGKMQRR
ncbi:MAG: hypothetical protein ACJ8FI_11190 [Sphingomicrobium sp.]